MHYALKSEKWESGYGLKKIWKIKDNLIILANYATQPFFELFFPIFQCTVQDDRDTQFMDVEKVNLPRDKSL